MPDSAISPEEYRSKLLQQLSSTFNGLRTAPYLSRIFDQEWHDTLAAEIKSSPLNDTFCSNRGFMFFQMKHWFRGVDWFEDAQSKVIEGQIGKLTEDDKIVVGFYGLDPIKTELPIFEHRLAALSSVRGQSEKFDEKIHQLKSHKHTFEFRNHFFELMVLGDFALKGVLKEIDVSLPNTASTVDARVNIDNRDLFVEVTFNSQEFFPVLGSGVCRAPWYAMFDAAISKIKKKAGSGKQLASVNGAPTILVVSSGINGPDEMAYSEAAQLCFKNAEFKKLSGMIVSDSWKFLIHKFISGTAPLIPLTDIEQQFLSGQ